jgi:hypothetical protein
VIYNKNLQKLSLWLAFSAILSATLMPTISRFVFQKDIPMLGMVQASQTAENSVSYPDCHSAPDSEGGSPSGHCLFCFIAGCPIELKPIAVVSLLFRAAQKPPPPLYALLVPYVQPIWEPNRARAPPVFL